MKKSLRVLVVEDAAPLADAIRSALELHEHSVATAASAEEALELPLPDVLVSDLGLGGMNGLELLETLRARGRAPRTIFMTGLPRLEDCRRALQLGACEFLTKPFAVEDLVRAVELEPSGVGRAARGTQKRSETFRRSYRSTVEAVERAARDVAAYALRCGVGPAARARIASSSAELLENCSRHAYREGVGPVEVLVEIDERQMFLTVSDEGVGFDALDVGLDRMSDAFDGGLARTAALAEDVRIRSEAGRGTAVELRFSVFRACFDEECGYDLSELDFFTPQIARRVLHSLESKSPAELYRLSPAMAVTIGRLLAGPDPKQALQTALFS